MKSKIALSLLTIMGLALLAYTSLRTLDLVQLTLPREQQAIGYLALVAFDGGLVGWTIYFLHGAHGEWQRGISAIMIAVSLAGVLLAFGADTAYQANARGTLAHLDPGLVLTAVWGMVIVIGTNVGAVTMVHVTDPDARRQQAEEEARDKIIEASIKQIETNAEGLAAELAPRLGKVWLDEMRAQYEAALPPAASGKGTGQVAEPPPVVHPNGASRVRVK